MSAASRSAASSKHHQASHTNSNKLRIYSKDTEAYQGCEAMSAASRSAASSNITSPGTWSPAPCSASATECATTAPSPRPPRR